MLNKIKRNIFFVLGFATLIYFIFIVFFDSNSILEIFQKISISIFLQSLLYIIISLILKFIRWHIYLKQLEIKIDLKNSVLIFLSGLIMSISPGKVGELLKSYLIKDRFNVPKSKTFPVILAERISEFISLVIITIIGIFIYNFDISKIFIPIVLIILIFVLFLNQSLKDRLLQYLSRSSFLKSRINKIDLFHSSIVELFKPIIFIKIQILSLLAWLAEFYAFYIIVSIFDENISYYFATFVYSISMIIGAISMLPGGIGTTEASLVYQLIKNGILESSAITVTFVIRIVTLWFSVLLGFVAYLIFLRKTKKNDKIL